MLCSYGDSMKKLNSVLFAATFLLQSLTPAYANEEVFESLHDEWPEAFNKIDKLTNDGKSYLMMVASLPTPAIDIGTAESFRRTLIYVSANGGGEGVLGHVMFAWKCVTPKGVKQGMSGMTGENESQIEKMVDSGWGFNAMLSTFKDGYLQTPEMIQEEKFDDDEEGKNTFFTVGMEVSQEECMSFRQHLKDFVTHPNKPMTRFGAYGVDPAEFTGGGCIDTALTLFAKANIFPAVKEFKRYLKVNEKFLGKGKELPPHTLLPNDRALWENKPKVSFEQFIFATTWEPGPNDKSFILPTEDPELLLAFLKSIAGQMLSPESSSAAITHREFHSIQPDPSGETPFGINRRFSWSRYYKNASNEPEYQRMYNMAKQWLAQRKYNSATEIKVLNRGGGVLLKKQ